MIIRNHGRIDMHQNCPITFISNTRSSNIFMPCFWPLDFNNCLTYSKNQFETTTFIKIKTKK